MIKLFRLFPVFLLLIIAHCSTIDVAVVKDKDVISKTKKFSIIPFEAPDNLGDSFTTKLSGQIIKHTTIQLIERDRKEMEKILDEQKINRSGIVDESKAARMGKFLGVDAIVTGKGYSLEIEYEKTEKHGKDKDTVAIEKKIIPDALSSFSIKVVNVESAAIMMTITKEPGIEWSAWLVTKYILGLGLIWDKKDMLIESSKINYISERIAIELQKEIDRIVK